MADLDALAEAARASGAPGVAIARREGGETAFGSAGTGDIESGAPLDVATQFYVGSVGKTFLAAVVLGLVGDGKLDLDEPAASYLSGVGPLDNAVRLRDLLRHTSGLRDFYAVPEFLEAVIEDPQRRWPLDDLLELALGAPPEPPGSRWSYSNTNYLLLSLVVERVGGSPSGELQEADDRLARGYIPADNPFLPAESGLVDATDLTAWLAYPTATVSTPADVARFYAALLDGTPLAPSLRRELLDAVPADGVECDAYGLGIARISSFFGTMPSPCGPAWGHLGLAAGYTTIALSRENGSRQVVLAANVGLIGEDAWHPLAEAAWGAFCGDSRR